jgi:cold shock CspA family protein
MSTGTIRRLIKDREFGFIRTLEGENIFFYQGELQGVEFSSLRVGQEVEFEIAKGRDGRIDAVKVRIAQPKGQ